jgi:hypothetical protein
MCFLWDTKRIILDLIRFLKGLSIMSWSHFILGTKRMLVIVLTHGSPPPGKSSWYSLIKRTEGTQSRFGCWMGATVSTEPHRLGLHGMQTRNNSCWGLLIFRENMLPPSSGLKNDERGNSLVRHLGFRRMITETRLNIVCWLTDQLLN